MSEDEIDMLATVCDIINIYDGPEKFLESFNSVNANAAYLYATAFAQSEICNRGFQQFFSNNTGVLAPEAVLGFQKIGMLQTSAIVEAACAELGEPYPRERTKRKAILGTIEEATFKPLETKFYDLIESENGGFLFAVAKFGQENKAG